jgi:putative transposase
VPASTGYATTSEVYGIKKIRLFLTVEQRRKLGRWMGVYRWVFNFTIARIHDCGDSANYKKHRKVWTAALPAWVRESGCPAHTVYGAMMDAERAMKSVYTKRRQGIEASKPVMRRKTQKTFFLLGNGIANGHIYRRLLGDIQSREPLPHHPKDSRILVEAGRWYVLIPEKRSIRQADTQGRICAVDPGIRTFLAWFSPDSVGKIGAGAFSRIVRLCLALDDLKSRIAKAHGRHKSRMKHAAERAALRIQHLVDEIQWQAIHELLEQFDIIIVPESNFTSAVCKTGRKIRRKSVRALLGYAFAKFRNRLLQKANEYGKRVIIVNEAYTSKTANWTGEVIHNLGGRKRIQSGGVSIDRDVNGALGIFLKGIVGLTCGDSIPVAVSDPVC